MTRMISRVSLSILLLTLFILRTSSTPDHDAVRAPPFTYGGSSGPEKWGNLSPSYFECLAGKHQSPVNIAKDKVTHNKNFKPLTRHYRAANATLVNNGFNIGVHYEEDAGVLVIDGKNYTLKQMHWHSPSEHRFDGVQYPAEIHLVHRAEDGSLSVVAILFQYSDPDPLLTKIKDKLDELAKEVCAGDEEAHVSLGTLDLKQLRRETRKYYRYFGSLTTPPCSEQVTWNILGKVRGISKDQVNAIKAPLHSEYKNNSRPCQALNDRKIELYDELRKK